MIKFEKEVYNSPEQMLAIIRGMRNPLNSWDRTDSIIKCFSDEEDFSKIHAAVELGSNDKGLMKRLVKSGSDHRKFLRNMKVYVDITAPLYWWKEFDTYKVGTVANSCSTMHKIHAKEFELCDFSHEHLDTQMLDVLENLIKCLNDYRNLYVNYNSTDFEIRGVQEKKMFWWQMIQMLPSSYNQKRTVELNYETLLHMYNSRKNHKLDEWHDFCDWIKQLPFSDIIIDE